MQTPLEKSDIDIIEIIDEKFNKFLKEKIDIKINKRERKDIISEFLGYKNFKELKSNEKDYVLPYQIEIKELKENFINTFNNKFPNFNLTTDDLISLLNCGFLSLKSINSLQWKLELKNINDDELYHIVLMDSGKGIALETGIFIKSEKKEHHTDQIISCSPETIKDFLNIKKVFGYNKYHLTLSKGIDDLLAVILAAIRFEASVLPLTNDIFNFREPKLNSALISLPALVRICGKELDLYAYVFDMNESETGYYAVLLNEYYSKELELFTGDIVEIEGEYIEPLFNGALYRDLLSYHHSVEIEYTVEDLKTLFSQYCTKEEMKLFDLWKEKYMGELNEVDQNFYATKIMHHMTNLILKEDFTKHKNLYLIVFTEEQYKKYKRNEISLNRESFKIRTLINSYMKRYLAEKGVNVEFIPFDENDYLNFIKENNLMDNDDSKLKWLESKFKTSKKLYDLGSFVQQQKIDNQI
jgi:hypothetical protein